jgi:phage recombination protein Bet
MQPSTSKAVATTKPSAINLMAARMSVEPAKLFETLKATVFSKATNEELLALVVVANEYGLNPFLKELYAFPAKGGGIVPIVSVDGWNKMLVNNADFDGMELVDNVDESGNLVSCTATIYSKSRKYPTKITEYLAECKRNTEPWNNMPHRMLRNRTLCQASRVAFGFSGVKHEEEADSITVESVVTTGATAQLPPAKIVTSDSKTPQSELESVIIAAGYSFTLLQKFGEESGNIPDATSIASFAEIPTDVAKRLLKNQTGLLAGLEKLKGE